MIDAPDDFDEMDRDEYEDNPIEAMLDECALGPDGQCGLAGSEHCDWDCPMRESEFFASSRAWRKKRKRKQDKPAEPDLFATRAGDRATE